MSAMVQAFADEAAPAGRLAEALGLPFGLVDLHRFPDGECLPTAPACPQTVIVYRSLDRPDPKLMPLLLTADAWRRGGAQRLILVAPYLCYLRQDAVFAPGQPISQAVIGRLIGESFDAVVTVDPHLHRTRDLSPLFSDRPVVCVSAAPALAAAIGPGDDRRVVVGPDAESEPWVRAIARELGADHVVLEKNRHGDHEVEIRVRDPAALRGRWAIVVDDVCSSGGTLAETLKVLAEAGASDVELAVSHALFDAGAEARLRQAGAVRILSTDSCPHPTNAVHLAPWLAKAVAPLLSR